MKKIRLLTAMLLLCVMLFSLFSCEEYYYASKVTDPAGKETSIERNNECGVWGCVALMVREGLSKVTFESCGRGRSWLGKGQSRWPAPQLRRF